MNEREVKAKSRAVLTQKGREWVLSTVDAQGRPHSRYMGSGFPVEGKAFDFYMVSGSSSRKVKQLAANPNAHILASKPDWSEIVSLSGRAALVKGKAAKSKLWDSIPGVHKYFKGKDDPEFAVINFKGRVLEYLAFGEHREPYIVAL